MPARPARCLADASHGPFTEPNDRRKTHSQLFSSDSEVGFFKSFFWCFVHAKIINDTFQKHVSNLYEFVFRQMPPLTTPKNFPQKKSKSSKKISSKTPGHLGDPGSGQSSYLEIWIITHLFGSCRVDHKFRALHSDGSLKTPPTVVSTQTQAAPQKIGKKNHVLPSMVDTLPRKSGQSFSRKTFSKSSILNQTEPDQTFRSSILTLFPASH